MNNVMVKGEMINRSMAQNERKKILQTNTPISDCISKVIKTQTSRRLSSTKKIQKIVIYLPFPIHHIT